MAKSTHLSASFPPTCKMIVLQLVISYFDRILSIVSVLAPEKDLTVVFGLRSLVFMPFNIDLPTSKVDWSICFLVSFVRSIVSFSSRLLELVLSPSFDLCSVLLLACESGETFLYFGLLVCFGLVISSTFAVSLTSVLSNFALSALAVAFQWFLVTPILN